MRERERNGNVPVVQRKDEKRIALFKVNEREKEEEESLIDHRTSGDPFDKHSAAAEANKVWQNFFSSSEKTIFWRYCRFLEPMSSTNFSHSVGYAMLK